MLFFLTYFRTHDLLKWKTKKIFKDEFEETHIFCFSALSTMEYQHNLFNNRLGDTVLTSVLCLFKTSKNRWRKWVPCHQLHITNPQPPFLEKKKIEQDPSINSLVFSYVKGIGKHMAKSPLIVIYHLCFARFQLLGAVRRPAVLISFAKRSPWRLDFSTISRLTVLLETHQQNKRFLKWGFTCRVLFLFFEFSFFSIYFEQTKTGNSETKVGFWWHLYKTPNFIGTSDDWFAGYKHGCQTKKVMPGSVQDVARLGGFLDPLVRLEVQGVNRPKHPKNPWSGAFCASQLGSWKPFFLLRRGWKCEMGWQGFFLGAKSKTIGADHLETAKVSNFVYG